MVRRKEEAVEMEVAERRPRPPRPPPPPRRLYYMVVSLR